MQENAGLVSPAWTLLGRDRCRDVTRGGLQSTALLEDIRSIFQKLLFQIIAPSTPQIKTQTYFHVLCSNGPRESRRLKAQKAR